VLTKEKNSDNVIIKVIFTLGGIVMKARFKTVDRNFDEGGFGKIIVVEDEILERKVAIKKLQYLDQGNKERFVKEAKILASLSYPNIPAIYDVEFSDNEMFIEFQFIEGTNLREIISQRAYPSIDEARKWFSQISLALEYAHSKKIIHRDIKPENIIISLDRNIAFLVDFGIALNIDDTKSIKQRGYVIGTPGYIAPEYIERGEVSNASDIFSLGITLYESLTGSIPTYDPYANISENNESIPPAIDELIKSCMVKDSALRLQSAKEFHSQINNVLRLDIPFSTLLTESRLYEIQIALSRMSAEEFHSKPLGQKLLIISRVKDLIITKSQYMHGATLELLKVLINLCIYEEESEFKFIFSSSLEWGFEMSFGENWQGNSDLRMNINNICKKINSDSFKIASSCLLDFIKEKNLEEKQKWYLHDLRPIVMSLLSNPNGNVYIRDLQSLYEDINKCSHKYYEAE